TRLVPGRVIVAVGLQIMPQPMDIGEVYLIDLLQWGNSTIELEFEEKLIILLLEWKILPLSRIKPGGIPALTMA
ncbi:19478_t:CDS:2, partial [Gigaspora rosea]